MSPKTICSNIISKANDKWGYPKGTFISIGIALAIIVVIFLIFFIAVDHYNKELDKLYQIQLQQEEEERIAAEIKAYNDALTLPQRQYDCVFNLPSLNLESKQLHVPITYQYPEYPAGCEIMAMTNMLNYYGFNLKKSTLIDNYLEYSYDDWINYYEGEPDTEEPGGTIMSPGIKHLADSFLTANSSKLKAFNVSGRNFSDLLAYIERGNPVQIWCTLDMSDPYNILWQIDNYKWYENTHSVLITGFNRTSSTLTVADSINGTETYKISTVEHIYNKLNFQAVVIVSEDELNSWMEGDTEASYL